MKTIKIIPLFLALLFSVSLTAQNNDEMRTLFAPKSDKKISHGGYGSFNIGYSQIENKDAIVIGGRAAWIANHRFALGLAGYGFFNSINKDYSHYDDPSNYFLTGGYGGIFFEPIVMPHHPVHVSFPILLGVGGVTAMRSQDWTNSNYHHDVSYYDSDAFMVFEPGVDIEFNIVKFFRLSLGASYRFTNGINLAYKYLDADYVEQTVFVDKNALDNFTVNVGFKFGWF